MGKGSNVQKAQAARERNQKKMGKSEEERKAASAKAAADANAFMCQLCRQTFMVNARVSLVEWSKDEAVQMLSRYEEVQPVCKV